MILTLLGHFRLQKLCLNGKKKILVTKQRFLIGYDAFDALRKQKSIPSFMTGQCMENEEGEASLLLVKENRLERGSRRQRSSSSLGDALSRIDLSKSHQSFHLRRLENQF